MTSRQHGQSLSDPDSRAIQQASRAVGLRLTLTSTVLVVAVLTAAFVFIFSRTDSAEFLNFSDSHEALVHVGAEDLLIAGLIIGVLAVILAGTMSWFATRRAVKPLGDALRLQRAFVADASHELRTPLAVLDARLQLLQRGLPAGDTSTATVAELRRDTEALIEVVNDLLAAADVSEATATHKPVALNPIVAAAVESLKLIADDRGLVITFTPQGEHSAFIPASRIQRCVIALLDNAISFSPRGSTISVTLSDDKKWLSLRVRDHGPGIQGIDPARIFDRFARSGTAIDGGGSPRSGFGIGLALVRETLERFGGRAAVISTSSEGTEIELLIPRAAELPYDVP